MIAALLGATQGFGDAVGIAKKKISGVHQGAAVLFGGDREAPKSRLREGIVDGAELVGIVADGAIVQIRLNEQNLGAAALEAHDARIAELAAIEADVVRSDAGG